MVHIDLSIPYIPEKIVDPFSITQKVQNKPSIINKSKSSTSKAAWESERKATRLSRLLAT